MNVAELIKALQEVPDPSATVTVESVGAATPGTLTIVDTSAANPSTFAADAPGAGAQPPVPGTVALAEA